MLILSLQSLYRGGGKRGCTVTHRYDTLGVKFGCHGNIIETMRMFYLETRNQSSGSFIFSVVLELYTLIFSSPVLPIAKKLM